jgi:hypothetical protein
MIVYHFFVHDIDMISKKNDIDDLCYTKIALLLLFCKGTILSKIFKNFQKKN